MYEKDAADDLLLIIASIVSAVITLCMGAVQIPVQDTLSVLLQHLFGTDTGTPVSIAFEQIVWQIRMPRIILGFLAGSGLALCGCVMQAVVQNPMADPYILGVSAGATLGATGSLFLGLGVISGFWAFVGAGSACFLVLTLSSADGKTTSVKLILSGMIVNALLTAFSNFIIAVAGDSDGMMSIKFWTMGSLTRAGWKNIGPIALIVHGSSSLFRMQAQTLDGLMLGEEELPPLASTPSVSVGLSAGALRADWCIGIGLRHDWLCRAYYPARFPRHCRHSTPKTTAHCSIIRRTVHALGRCHRPQSDSQHRAACGHFHCLGGCTVLRLCDGA